MIIMNHQNPEATRKAINHKTPASESSSKHRLTTTRLSPPHLLATVCHKSEDSMIVILHLLPVTQKLY